MKRQLEDAAGVTRRTPGDPPPQGRRLRLAAAAERLGLLGALRPLHNLGRAPLIVLAYHRIAPVDDCDSYPLDLDLISATPAEFEWQMRRLRERMNPVSLSQVIAHLEGRATLPRRAVAVTFDDGFQDTHAHAFPVLKRYSIPATIFVTTGYVESGEPFWFELAAHLAMRAPAQALHLPDCDLKLPRDASNEVRRRDMIELHTRLKALPDAERAALMSRWRRELGQFIDASAMDVSRPLRWPQVLEMSRAGIAFGSHTVTHPNLARASHDELRWELGESRRVLERHLDAAVDTIAYPFGTSTAYDERVMRFAEQAGYRLAVSYLPGVNWLGTAARFQLRRKGIARGTSRPYFRAMMNLPAWIH